MLTTTQEDVLELVQLSESIRKERQRRVREIEYERAMMERADRRGHRDYGPGPYEDERITEREVIYAGRKSRRSGGW